MQGVPNQSREVAVPATDHQKVKFLAPGHGRHSAQGLTRPWANTTCATGGFEAFVN